jgi:hypothetical protein
MVTATSAIASEPQLGLSSSPVASSSFLPNSLESEQVEPEFTPITQLGAEMAMDQVTSVSQLTDVKPTDWAFQALQSLVERYGCIVGYPDKTYRGNRSLSRYEFAAGLNACLDKIQELIAAATADFVKKEDLETVKRLQEEFAAELAALRGRIDALDVRTATLEKQQFSTTTKLIGVMSYNVIDAVSGDGQTETVGQYATYLGLSTSFTGRDLLLYSMYASNTNIPEYTVANNGRDVGSTREGLTTWAYGGSTGSNLFSLSLEYLFPVFTRENDRMYVTLAANNGFNTSRFLLPFSGLTWEGANLGSGPVSAFGQRSPMYRLGGGSGIIVNYDNGPWRITGGYLASKANNPSEGAGLFDGNYLALAQVNFTPSSRFGLALAYRNNYFSAGEFAFNNQYSFGPNSPGFVGTGLANRFDNAGVFFNRDVPVVSNTYGVQGYYAISPRFVVGGFATKIDARLLGRGDADIWTYALNLAFPDLGKKGNLGGIIVGVEPMLTGLKIGDRFVGGFKRDTSLHIEAFYQYNISDRIAVTPGVMWITAPNQDNSNQDLVVLVLRTTFSF